jgi:geranylgeranyl reductase family protein
MDRCDVLIVGGGPAGSSCAWRLRRAGLDVVVLDKRTFPRDKVCGGWITPPVLEELEMDAADYARGRVFQPITGFRTSRMGDPEVTTDYGRPVSYGIRRFEFDDYLLKRSGARLVEGAALESLEWGDGHWVANGRIRAPLVVGAGGHFCPVARRLGARPGGEVAVAAQEAEFEMDASPQARCSIRGEIPELYFCGDLRGYGWCFRKGNVLNLGLGRLGERQLLPHVEGFLEFLKAAGKVTFDLPARALGHAYLLYDRTQREVVGDGVLLIGDAAGLAYSQSGEGIRPAIESGLLAAKAIESARGNYRQENLESYRALLAARLGNADGDWARRIGRRLPPQLVRSLGRLLLATRWFPRHIVLDRWFLHADEPALNLA